MSLDILGTGTSTTATNVVMPTNAPATARRAQVQLGQLIGLNLNSVAATTIFTVPAGVTRAIPMFITVENFSIAATTASVSYGASATPTDWAATATMPGAATTKFVRLTGGAVATGSAFYAAGVNFVANVTIAQGVAATCDVHVYGYFE